jgi:transcriptional regulator with AAA-type ATPase domain
VQTFLGKPGGRGLPSCPPRARPDPPERRPAILFTEAESTLARAVGGLAAGNPFLPERLEAERAALGDAFDPAGTLWHSPAEPEPAANVVRIAARATALANLARARLADGARPRAEEVGLYEDLVLYTLYERHQGALFAWFRARTVPSGRVPLFERVRRDLGHYLDVPGCASPLREEAAHVFAGYYQVRRAFHHIHASILGESGPARRLRAAVWQSIFTRDGRRYRRALYARMGDVATLVTGPSGTGKELVARAIGLSGYIPFDEKTQAFAEPAAGAFFPLNLAALSPTLIESELFGHRRGAFTGALEDRKGWFETCPPVGTVFLDEIGEVDAAIQVKLLRVLQTRTFQRLGDTADRTFGGKLIAATNRDLRQALAAGRFREDFYYRLCADLLVTPSLAERLRDTPGELRTLCRAIARRIAGNDEADAVAAEAEAWIAAHLGPDYPWPGNVRELEQCLRNLVIRGTYEPQGPTRADVPADFLAAVEAGALSADALLRHYCTWVYAQTGSYGETARRLGLDPRTVRDRIDPAWLTALRNGDGAWRLERGPRPPAGV